MADVFLSYAREDEEPFAHRLERDLREAGLNVWFDRISLESHRLTFHQEIKDAIRGCDRVVCIAGPKASVSKYVRGMAVRTRVRQVGHPPDAARLMESTPRGKAISGWPARRAGRGARAAATPIFLLSI